MLKLQRLKLVAFLFGWVFFNYFTRCEEKISIELVARAWNRGVALMCKRNTEGFNYVIPVRSQQEPDETNLGPMFDDWTNEEIKAGCRRFSVICINSKNFHDPKNHDTDALNMAMKTANFKDKWSFDQSKNIYLSILQEFGPERGDGNVTFPKIRGEGPKTQIPVVVNGYGAGTYKCLADLPSDPSDGRRQLLRQAIKQLKERAEFGGKRRGDDVAGVALGEGFFGMTAMKREWREHWKGIAQLVEQVKDVDMPDTESVTIRPGPEGGSNEGDLMEME